MTPATEPWQSIERRLRPVWRGEAPSDDPAALRAAVARPPFAGFSAAVAALPVPRVLFVCRRPYFTIVRQALHLREQGFAPLLLHLEPIETDLGATLDAAFVHRLHMPNSIALCAALLATLPVEIVHLQCWMFDYFTAASLVRAQPRPPLVVEFYDVTSLYGTRADLLARFSAEAVDLDLALEGLICREADALVLRFSAEAIERLRARHGALAPTTTFWPYPSPRLTCYRPEADAAEDKPSGQRLVFAGGLYPIDPTVPASLFPAQGLLPMFEKLVAQGLAVDVLHDPYRPLRRNEPTLAPYFALAERHPEHFRLHEGVPLDQLAQRMCHHDFGLNLFDIPPACAELRREQITSAMGTKLFAYLEAGLPVLVNREYTAAAALVEAEGIGVAIPSSQIDHLGEVLARTDRRRLRAGVRRYNQRHGMDQEIRRLARLYEHLVSARGQP